MYENTYFWNNNEDDIAEYVKTKKPKILAFVEPNRELFEKVKALNIFKFTFYRWAWPKSIAFFSNEEFIKNDIVIKWDYPIWIFEFKDFDFILVHPYPPFDTEAYNKQKDFFKEVKKIIDEKNQKWRKFLLVWDFNSSVYSRVFQSNFSEYQYHPIYSRSTDGILTIPIDYAISNRDIEVLPGSKLSSDHIPLHISFE